MIAADRRRCIVSSALWPSALTHRSGRAAGPRRFTGKTARRSVLLNGIPQSGNTLGKPNAPVTITEFGDLVCSIGDAFALSSEPQLISDEVATGKVKLVFRAFETASSTANDSECADHAGRRARRRSPGQGVELRPADLRRAAEHDRRQAAERFPTSATPTCANRAAQISGLNLAKWQAGTPRARHSTAAVNADAPGRARRGRDAARRRSSSPGRRGQLQFSDQQQATAVPTLPQLESADHPGQLSSDA